MIENCRLTCDFIYGFFCYMIHLMHPFTVTFEVYLRGWRCFADQSDGFVFYNVYILWFNMKMRQRI